MCVCPSFPFVFEGGMWDLIVLIPDFLSIKGSSQHKVGGEWFEIKLGKISRMLVKYEVLPIPNVIFVC